MREQAMVTWRPFQKTEHEGETVRCFVPYDPAALGRDNDRHDRKAGPPGAHEIVAGVRGKPGAVAREAAERMRALPKKPESLTLNEIDEHRRTNRIIWRSGGGDLLLCRGR